ncbi:hypothetical protein GGI12_002270 [Dipsacomyces acuminosporus]|nr:hypothetical protein GGI12_002270 [Dipsacomyces acuminosporus]
MALSSPAQNLPVHIIEPIVEYATGIRRLRRHKIADTAAYRCSALLPTLALCQQWREAALPLFYQEAALVSRINGDVVTHWPPQIHALERTIADGYASLVKAAYLYLPLDGILSGSVLTLLSNPPYKDVVCRGATQLMLKFTSAVDARRKLTSEAGEIVDRLCGRVLEMFPSAKEKLFSANIDNPFTSPEWIHRCLTRLARDAASQSYDFTLPHGICVELPAELMGLRHILLNFRTINSHHIAIVRRNWQTLECVHLTKISPRQCLDLVLDPEGVSVQYPNLHTLDLSTGHFHDIYQRTSPSGCPFPVLAHINCENAFPFANDVLLRGNRMSLKTVAIDIDRNAWEMFANTDLLSGSGNYPSLRQVTIYNSDSGKAAISSDRAAGWLSLAFSVPSNVCSLKIGALRRIAGSDILAAARVSRVSQNLRVLDIPHVHFTVSQAVELIAMLPAIRTLTIELLGGSSSRDQPLTSGEVQMIHERYYPVDTRLSALLFGRSNAENTEKHFDKAVLLVSLIPSLRRVFTNEQDCRPFTREIKAALASPVYSAYVDHLNSVAVFGR